MTSNKIEKALYNDKHAALSRACGSKFNKSENGEYYWVTDFDDEYVYICESGEVYRCTYTYYASGDVTLGDEMVHVNRQTEYVVSSVQEDEDEMMEKSVESAMIKFFKKHFGGSTRGDVLPTIKALNEEEMIAVEPMYVPPETPDGVGEGMKEEHIRKMVDSANRAISDGRMKANLFHKKTTDKFSFLRAWVNECDCIIGESLVKKGQPIVEVQFNDKALWEARKSGKIMGLSIGAKCKSKRKVDG